MKGTSPLRLLLRNSPQKNAQEGVSANTTSMTPPRKVLTPIPESVSNPLTSENLSNDASTVKGKVDATTPKKRSVGHRLFPDTENNGDGTTIGTPGKNSTAITPGRAKNILAGLSKKSPSAARPVQEAGNSDVLNEGVITPSRRRLGYSNEANHTGVPTKSSCKPGSEHTTPKSLRNPGIKPSGEAEGGTSSRSNCSQLVNGTPSSTKTARSLKYGTGVGSLSSGLLNNRIVGAAILNRQLSMPQPTQQIVEQHFDLEEDPHFWEEHNVQVCFHLTFCLIRTVHGNHLLLISSASFSPFDEYACWRPFEIQVVRHCVKVSHNVPFVVPSVDVLRTIIFLASSPSLCIVSTILEVASLKSTLNGSCFLMCTSTSTEQLHDPALAARLLTR